MTVPDQEAPANYAQQPRVCIRLSGFTGCKGSADGMASLMKGQLNPDRIETANLEYRGVREFLV